MHFLRQARDFESRAPLSSPFAVHRWAGDTAALLPQTQVSDPAASLLSQIDPADLVARACALLDEETAAWQQRRHADLLPGSRR